MVKKLNAGFELRACYEAGPTGYVLFWQLNLLGVKCEVIAPSLIPTKAGDKVKTDRRDAMKLAKHYRNGELTPVWVPDAAHEALRDLVRTREDARADQQRARQGLGKFLLRHGKRPEVRMANWGVKHLEWIKHLRRVIVEAAWAYQFRPWVGGYLAKRQKGLDAEIVEIGWKAQHRLHSRYKKLLAAGKNKPQIVTAVGREMLGFIWAIAVKTEAKYQVQQKAAA